MTNEETDNFLRQPILVYQENKEKSRIKAEEILKKQI
jgi:hypothetical protein